MRGYLLSITRLNRNTLLYIAAFSSVGFGYVGVTAVLGNLYVLKLGFDTAFLGMLTGTGQLVWALTALPAGMIGARYGLRGAIITGYILIALWFTVYINIPLLPREYWSAGLIISNILNWGAVSLASVNGTPYLMAISPENERNKAFTLTGAVIALTAFVGSLVGGLLPGLILRAAPGLGEVGAFRIVLMLPVLSYLFSIVCLIKARSVPTIVHSTEETASLAAPVGLLVFMGVLFGIQIASEAGVMVFLNVYFAKELLVSTGLIGIIFAIVRLMPFFISPLLPLALNRWGSGLTMAASYALVTVSAVSMALFHNWIIAAAAFLLVSIASSAANTSRGIFGQESVHPRWRTTVSAVATISLACGGALAAYAGGLLIEQSGFQALFLACAALAGASMALYSSRRAKKPAVVIDEEAA